MRHPAEKLGVDRRAFLAAGAGGLTALALAGCNSSGPKAAEPILASYATSSTPT